MSEREDLYCRLCAEPTPKTQLISTRDDLNVSTKMLWINIDVSSSNTLPNTICLSCLDALEKTWVFLHKVRSAQQKLVALFSKKVTVEVEGVTNEIKQDNLSNAGEPVDENWDDFRTKEEVKIEGNNENIQDIATLDPDTLMDYEIVKSERQSDDDMPYNDSIADTHDFNTSDSDLPLHLTVKKKKIKKKKKEKYGSDTQEADMPNPDAEAVPLDISSICNVSWDDYMCRCANCDAQCKNIASLRLHSLQIHACCCIFKCSDCGKVIANHKSFVSHVRLHKDALRYCCELCNKKFTMTAFVKKHRNTAHRDMYLTMCQNCGANFETQEQLQDHILIYAKGYKKHRKREKDEKDLKCEHCNKEFKSRSNLHQHKVVHTERSRNFSCHVCGKMFFTKGSLITHMMTHEDKRPYKCEFCPMAFRARGNLQSHISLHSGMKPFVCEQCGKSFRVKRHLKSHSIVHTDLMPFVCEYCNKQFRFKTRLNLHLRQHTGAKPYNCVYCQRDFTNGSNYKKHMKRRHNIDTSKKKFSNVANEQNLNSNNVNTNQT